MIARLCEDYENGIGVVELAEDYGVHRDTVNCHLRRSGVELRPSRVLTDRQTKEVLRRHAAGESMASLGRRFGVDPQTVANVLRRRAKE